MIAIQKAITDGSLIDWIDSASVSQVSVIGKAHPGERVIPRLL